MTQPVVDIMLPSSRKWSPETAISFVGVCLGCPGVVRWPPVMKQWLYIDQARNLIAAEVLGRKPLGTHVLCLDDDMAWPRDLLARLLSHNRPVVGAMYFLRPAPHSVVAGGLDGFETKPLDFLPHGLAQVGYLGMGATLIETRLFREMRDRFKDEAWFRSNESGEDVWFFHRLKKMAVPVFLDGSLRCGHMTEACVTEEHWKHYHPEKS